MSGCEIITGESGRRLILAPVLDLLMAASLRDLLRESVIVGGRLEIDAGAVERMSTPCIQVLIAAGRAFAEKGIEFVILRPTEAFMGALFELGLFSIVAEWNIEQ
jgi:chemotaxis protein CheX